MTWISRARRLGIAAAATALSLGCSDGPGGSSGSIQISISPGSLSVARGASGSVTATLTRGGGFVGNVILVVQGVPAGVIVQAPTQLTGSTTTATVTVTIGSAVALGTYTVTIRGSADGVGDATGTYQLTVIEAPGFSLSVTPAARTIVPGASSGATVSIVRGNGFVGPVTLALLTPPAGITGTFDPALTTGDGTALAVSVAASVAPGSYPLTIQGFSPGPGIKTTTLTVTVPPPPAGGNVQYEFCDPAEAPVFVGYQDGNGAWQAVTGATSGGTTRYTLNLAQTFGGVMFVYPPAANPVAGFSRVMGRQTTAARPTGTRTPALLEDAYVTQILYATRVELTQDGSETCALTQPTKSVSGTVAGVTPGSYGIVSANAGLVIFDGAAPDNPVTFFGVRPGPFDVVGTRTVPGSAPNKTFVLRNLNVANGGSLPSPIDFNGAASAAPATANVTITGGGGDDLEAFVDLVSANGVGALWFDLSPSATATRPWGGLASMLPGELHSLVVFAAPGGSFTDFRVAVKHVGPVANQAIALTPMISVPASTPVAGGAYPRFRFQGTLPSDYNKGVAVEVLGVEGTGNIFSILATNTWLAAVGQPLVYDFTMPNVTGLAGFPAAARLTAGTNDLSASAWGFTGTGVFDVRPALGTEFKAAVKGGTLVVP